MTNTRKISSVLVKPAGPDCNMSCAYCFYLGKSDLYPDKKVHRMGESVLETMVQQVMSDGGRHISFGWQGGEPMLMGLPFYQKAVDLQQRYGKKQIVGNSLQTNGILVDRKWTKFLREYRFLVGLSLDGPEHVHNRYRLSRGGKNTWAWVTDTAKLLLDQGAAVNALVVVSDYSVDYPEEIYLFHKELGLNHMQFIPCVEADKEAAAGVAPFSVPAEKYGKFLTTLFDLWISDFAGGIPTTSIRFFESVFYSYVNQSPPECSLLEECGNYVVVEHNGDVFPCDFFVDPELKLGNVMEGSIMEMLNSRLQRNFGARKAELPEECLQCKWLKHCRGGCHKDRSKVISPDGKSYLCEAYRAFFEHADPIYLSLAEEWKEAGNR